MKHLIDLFLFGKFRMYFLVSMTIFLGIGFIWFITRFLKKTLQNKVTPHVLMLITNLIFYFLVFILFTTIAHEAGFKLSAFLGAAGIIGIVIGLAAQTSIANIVGGIFLLLERPFIVGDFIYVQEISGFVDAINLFSTTLITTEKTVVRLPNEIIVKNPLINRTFFNEQRIDYVLQFRSDDNFLMYMNALEKKLLSHPFLLKDPKPILIVSVVHDKTIELLFRFWINATQVSRTELFASLNNEVYQMSKELNVPIGMKQITK